MFRSAKESTTWRVKTARLNSLYVNVFDVLPIITIMYREGRERC